MRHGSIARRTSDGTIATAAYELIAGEVGLYVKQMQITLAAATASTYGLGYPATIGITPTTPINILGTHDPTPCLAKTALAWGTGPTIPTQFFRQVSFPNVITSSINWIFENGLMVPAGKSLVLWNIAANGVVDVSVDIIECIR